MYKALLSDFATVSVRRLSWALGISIPAAVNIMVKLTPGYVNCQKICQGCQDKSKCEECIFSPSKQEGTFLNFHLTEKEETAMLAVQ